MKTSSQKSSTTPKFFGLAAYCTIAGTLSAQGPTVASADAPKRPNVLFIAIDDLRPELACYGHDAVKTPHIDSLASRATVFNRAYCQQAVCGPSRLCVMTGVHPDRLRIQRPPAKPGA